MPKFEDIFLLLLYESNSVKDFLNKYAYCLSHSTDPIDKLHATKIEEYINTVYNKTFLKLCRRLFNNIYDLIDKSHTNVNFCIDGRRKSICSFEKKIRQCIATCTPIDIKDLLAFRITIFGKDPKLAINNCYCIANTIIEFLIGKGFILCQCEPVSNTSSNNKLTTITIPTQSLLKPAYENYIKDYILHPKTNGYQSLHLRFRDTKGHFIELQIRTFAMHLHAENGEANHEVYKSKKYDSTISDNINIEELKFDGIGMSGNKLIDKIGLILSLVLFSRYKTVDS